MSNATRASVLAAALLAMGYFVGHWHAEVKAEETLRQVVLANAVEEDGCDPGYENDCGCQDLPPDDPEYCADCPSCDEEADHGTR